MSTAPAPTDNKTPTAPTPADAGTKSGGSRPVTPVPKKVTYDQADYVGIVWQAGFRGADIITAARVAWRETRGRPAQINPQAIAQRSCPNGGGRPLNARGMFQFVPACHPHLDMERLLNDPAYSARSAAETVKKSGWGAWEAGTGKVPPAGLDSMGSVDEWRKHYATAVGRGYVDKTADIEDAADIVIEAGDSATDVVEAVADPLAALADFVALLSRWDTWRRVLLVLGGMLAAGLGLAAITADATALPAISNVRKVLR